MIVAILVVLAIAALCWAESREQRAYRAHMAREIERENSGYYDEDDDA